MKRLHVKDFAVCTLLAWLSMVFFLEIFNLKACERWNQKTALINENSVTAINNKALALTCVELNSDNQFHFQPQISKDLASFFKGDIINKQIVVVVNNLRDVFQDSIGDMQFHFTLLKRYLEMACYPSGKIDTFLAFYEKYPLYLKAKNKGFHHHDLPASYSKNSFEYVVQSILEERNYLKTLFGLEIFNKVFLQDSLKREYRLKSNAIYSSKALDLNQKINQLQQLKYSASSSEYLGPETKANINDLMLLKLNALNGGAIEF